MDAVGRYERIRELNTQRAKLTHTLKVYKIFASKIINKDLINDDYENYVNAQIDEINAKLFLIGG